MKKKGLIISTIVMVIVLIASLTTATYAWFTASASATISEMVINTAASKGLQIASVVFGDDGVTSYNGDLTLDNTSKKWTGTTEGYGSAINLTSAGDYLISDMYGASGDGVSMFAQTNSALPLSVNNPLVAATENTQYLALDFALLATSDGTAFIDQIYVNPSAVKSGMAGSMRIALFATTAGNSVTAPTWSVDSNGQMLYIPYGLTYNNTLFTNSAESTKYYTAAGTTGASIGTLSNETLQKTWDGKVATYGTTTATKNKTLTAVGNEVDAKYSDLAAAKAAIGGVAEVGEMTAGQVIYLRLVVWFEGESAACIQEFAGGGATVQINFSLEEKVADD